MEHPSDIRKAVEKKKKKQIVLLKKVASTMPCLQATLVMQIPSVCQSAFTAPA